MYLGLFFVHWSRDENNLVYKSEPIEISECPFCNQPSTVIYKIYNKKTKHYSSFSVGKGKFFATFVCRNCTSEGTLDSKAESNMIKRYQVFVRYDEINDMYKTNPKKAIKELEKLIHKNRKTDIDFTEMNTTLTKWTASNA